MNVAEQYPARTDNNGVTWFRPARDPGLDFSQWGWTSQREQAHPDYRAHYDAQTGGLHPARLCGGDCAGCVEAAEGAAPYRWGFPLARKWLCRTCQTPCSADRPFCSDVCAAAGVEAGPHTVVHTDTGDTAPCAGPAGCLPCHVTEREAPVQAKAEERAAGYVRAFTQLLDLAATLDDTQAVLW
ncbi:hypothetical protein SEA_RANDO14_76 [Mycobacterium phage Rando14]|uniref:Uncharacterized protein n=1 Tax=Mycobacterium phage Rando14 TaxID=2301556 RepID=A0A385D452_9CAUD|nr:hypothetical protein I5G75_gp20 [Mycobacterium phage Rando14]AXQ53096.1 hypothetical protein SEA_RANDO14_76 [Mycobacterium phage Rando14]